MSNESLMSVDEAVQRSRLPAFQVAGTGHATDHDTDQGGGAGMSYGMIDGPHGKYPAVIYHESTTGGVWRIQFREGGIDISPPIDAEQDTQPITIRHSRGHLELRESL